MTKTITKLSDVQGTVKNYVKKPIVVKAIKLQERIKINTREGSLYGERGDFLIEGIKGEIYPCGRQIFEETYDEMLGNTPQLERIPVAVIYKQGNQITMHCNKEANIFEIFGFIKVWIELTKNKLLDSMRSK